MSLEWEQIVVDSMDPAALARWWQNALGWVSVGDTAGEHEIRPAVDRLPGMLFLASQGRKMTKNRLHLDFRPDDQASEVARFLGLGASRADVGQGTAVSWVVLADPEGNEFCVLSSRST